MNLRACLHLQSIKEEEGNQSWAEIIFLDAARILPKTITATEVYHALLNPDSLRVFPSPVLSTYLNVAKVVGWHFIYIPEHSQPLLLLA